MSGVDGLGSFDRALAPLRHALDAATLRAKAIRSNLANASTPGYRRVEVRFESLIADRLAGRPADAASILAATPRLVQDGEGVRADGNNVEVEKEVADMERTRIQVETLLELASLRIQGLRNAITSR